MTICHDKVSKQLRMKLSTFAIASVLTGLLTMPLFSACKATKHAEQEALVLLLHLADRKDGTYLEQTYQAYQPKDIKRSNRSLNQYQVTFANVKKTEADLLEKLETDPNVLEATKVNQTGVDIQSGTNQKSSKVSPIRNH